MLSEHTRPWLFIGHLLKNGKTYSFFSTYSSPFHGRSERACILDTVIPLVDKVMGTKPKFSFLIYTVFLITALALISWKSIIILPLSSFTPTMKNDG